MLTIIEGPDCSGKTTLMQQAFLAKEGFIHEHSGPPSKAGAWSDYTTMLRKLWDTRTINADVVFDRFVYGELIYGPILRPKTKYDFTRAHVRMLERVMLSLQSVLITAITDYETSHQLWLERQEQELINNSDKLKEAYDNFSTMFDGSGLVPHLPTVRFDLARSGIKAITRACNILRTPLNTGPGIGMFRPGNVLMVGDQINSSTAPHRDWTFVAQGESSLWLAQQLDEAEVSEQSLYWINAITPDGLETSAAFLKELQPSKIITLGTSANVWCKRNITTTMIPVEHIPHPAFWKRFHSGIRYPLHDILGSSALPLQRSLQLDDA